MTKGSIAYIRRYKNKNAKIGKIVTYAGHPYRIANAEGDALILRSQLRVHPNDESLNYEPSLDTYEGSNEREINRLKTMLYEMTSLADWQNAGFSIDDYHDLKNEYEAWSDDKVRTVNRQIAGWKGRKHALR